MLRWTRLLGRIVLSAAVVAASLLPVSPALAAGTVTGLTVAPATVVAGAASTYDVTFTTSLSGALAANTDTITVTFAAGSTVPALTAADVTVSLSAGAGTPVPAAPTVAGTDVTLKVPATVTASQQVTVHFLNNAGHAVLAPTAAGSKTLTVSTSIDTTPVNGSYTVVAGPAATLTFASQPAGSTGGALLATQPALTLTDASGNPISGASVTLALGANPGSGTLKGTTSLQTNPSGQAVFSGLSLDKAGTGYTLKATSGSVNATSVAFDVSVGPASKLLFTRQPSGGTYNTVWATQPQVGLYDAGGNLVTNNPLLVTLTIGADPNNTSTLGGTAGVNVDNTGHASFSGLSIDKVGDGYTLVASAAGLTPVATGPFNISAGAPDHVGFFTQPGSGTGGSALSSQPVVAIYDAANHVITGLSPTVTLTLAGPAGAQLLGTATVPMDATSGKTTFAGLAVDKTGTGYTLIAAVTGVSVPSSASNTSAPFDVTVGPADHLGFFTQPGGGASGAVWAVQPVVGLYDKGGNLVLNADQTVTLSLSNPGGAALTGTTLSAPIDKTTGKTSPTTGFSGLKVDKSGSYTLLATGNTVSTGGAPSQTFSIGAGTADHLGWSTQPAGTKGGATFAIPPVITLYDAANNVVTGSTLSVTIAVDPNPGNGLLLGTKTLTIGAGGSVSATDLSITKVGTAYTLTASATGVTSATSTPFNVSAGPPASMSFSVQPGGASGGSAFTAQPILTLYDAGGNPATATTALSVTVTLGGTPAGSLSGTTTQPIAVGAGQVAFSGLSIDKVGSYTLVASATGLTGATSNAFAVTAGTPVTLGFFTQPTGAVAGLALSTQPVVGLYDAGGNLVPGFAQTITLSFGTNPTSATLSGTATASVDASGKASFSGLSIDKAGNGYTLVAKGNSISTTGVQSAPLSVTTVPTHLAFVTQPGGASGGSVFTTQPVVGLFDTGEHLVQGVAQTVTISIGANAVGGALSGATTVGVDPTTGKATFSGLSIDKAWGSYTLVASGSGVSTGGVASSAFAVSVGPAHHLAFRTQPMSSLAGAALSTQPVVGVVDAGGNLVGGVAQTVTVSLGNNPGGAILSGTRTVNVDGSGQATFSGLSIDRTGSNFTLLATGNTVSTGGVSSNPFGVSTGIAHHLGFSGQPGGATAGFAMVPAPVVTLYDASGNVVSNSSSVVTITLTGTSGAQLYGPTSLTLQNGVATFSGLVIQTAGTYTLTASSSVVSGSAASSSFTISPGALSRLQVLLPGENTAPGTAGGKSGYPSALATGVAFTATVKATDTYWNVVPVNDQVQLSSSDYLFIPVSFRLSGGSGTTQVILRTPGYQTLQATDLSAGGVSAGTSSSINLTGTGGAGASFSVTPDGYITPVGGALGITVTVVDAYGNPATGFAGTIHFSPTGGDASVLLPPDYTFTAYDSGRHRFTVTPSTPGTFGITVTSSWPTSLTGTSSTILAAYNVPLPSPQPSTGTVTVTGLTQVRAGQTATYQAAGVDPGGQPVTTGFTWSATAGAIGGGTWVAPTYPGTYTITATAPSGLSGKLAITVLPGTATTVSLAPNSAITLSAGIPQYFTFSAADSYGNAITTGATWTVSGVGTITNSGAYTATKTGTATVSVSLDGISKTSGTITVGAGPAASIEVKGALSSVQAGGIVQFSATVSDSFGNPVTGAPITWSASSGSIAQTGILTAGSAGVVTVTATSGGASGTATVTVTGGTDNPGTGGGGNGNGGGGGGNGGGSNLPPVSAGDAKITPDSTAVPTGANVLIQPVVVAGKGDTKVTFNLKNGLTPTAETLAYYYDQRLRNWIAVPTALSPSGATATLPAGAPVALLRGKVRQHADTAGHWANAAILELESLGVVGGMPDGSFDPEAAVTRYQMARVLAGAANLDVTNADPTVLSNLADAGTIPDWARPYVAAVYAANLMQGTGNRFDGDAPVTRAQMAAMLGRLLPSGAGAGRSFTDDAAIPTWAAEGVQTAVVNGVITGFPDGSFRPNEPLTRAQMARVVAKLIELQVGSGVG